MGNQQQQQTSNGQVVRTVNVKGGKPYVGVAERVRLAHDAGGYTMLASEAFTLGDTGRWWFRVTIGVGNAQYTGTAEIKFNAKPGTADGDSPVECAETSALGRAFAFAGVGMLDSIASADEVRRNEQQHTQPAPASAQAAAQPQEQAQAQQQPAEDGAAKITADVIAKLKAEAGKQGVKWPDVLVFIPTAFNGKPLASLTIDEGRSLWTMLHDTPEAITTPHVPAERDLRALATGARS